MAASFPKDSTSSLITRLAILAVDVVQSAVTARVLHPEGNGAVASAMLLPQLLVSLAPLGINWAVTYHLGRRSFDRETLVRSALAALIVLCGLATLICLGAGFLLKDVLLRGVPLTAFLLAVLTLTTQISLLFLDSLFLGEMRIREANLLAAARALLFFLCILLLLVVLSWGVTGMLAAQALTEGVLVVVAFTRFGGITPWPLIRRDVIRTLLK